MSFRDELELLQHAVDEMQRPVGPRREIRIVRDDDEARADGAIELEHQLEHLARGPPVEIAGRLVGEHAPRRGHQRAGKCDALPLAAGKLARQVAEGDDRARRARASPRAAARALAGVSRRIMSGIATFSSAVNSGSRWWNW